jgi:hypothetical protein
MNEREGMMSQLSRRIQLPLFGMILLGLLGGIYLAACRRFTKKSAPSQTITRHTVKKPAADVLEYWTADKMHGARGMDLPRVDAPDQKHRPSHNFGPHQD